VNQKKIKKKIICCDGLKEAILSNKLAFDCKHGDAQEDYATKRE